LGVASDSLDSLTTPMHRFKTWRDALNAAPNEKAVMAVVREYIDAIDPQLIGLLPIECQKALAGEMDLQTAAVTILHSELTFRGSEQIGQLLHEIAHTFAAASIRLSWFRTEPIIPASE